MTNFLKNTGNNHIFLFSQVLTLFPNCSVKNKRLHQQLLKSLLVHPILHASFLASQGITSHLTEAKTIPWLNVFRGLENRNFLFQKINLRKHKLILHILSRWGKQIRLWCFLRGSNHHHPEAGPIYLPFPTRCTSSR